MNESHKVYKLKTSVNFNMGGKKSNWYNLILIAIIVGSLVMLFLANVNAITGNVTEGSTSSEVTIQSFLAMQMSSNLSAGIVFENVNVLPAVNVNASKNYNGTSNSSLYYINVSTDSNSAVDFCLRADGGMFNAGLDEIVLGNETYSTNVTTSNSTIPALTETAMTTSYFKNANNIAIGSANYYRFWLDVPAGQPTGTYDNIVSFKGVVTGNSC